MYWVESAPQVRQMIKRLFPGHSMVGKAVLLKRTPDSTENLLWITERWPHEISPALHSVMRQRVEVNKSDRLLAEEIMAGRVESDPPRDWNPLYPMREYQRQGIAVARIKRGLLVGDDVGLGKTAIAIGVMAAESPALVVCQSHLKQQWVDEIRKFCPSLECHIVQRRAEYSLPPHDVTIMGYNMLDTWQDRRQWRTVIYDEIQELRRSESKKWEAASNLAGLTEFRIGLSATPVYNYGGEIFSVMETLAPGAMGTEGQFCEEWGASHANKWRVEDPQALGAWLKDQCVFIRRTRQDVKLELPAVLQLNHIVQHDGSVIERLRGQANELAEKVLKAGFTERGQAARQLDILLRKLTGIAKAPFVADFVAELVEKGEKVLLGGWHRDVYEIWKREFAARGIRHRLYTGSESAAGKQRAKAAFMSTDPADEDLADVLVMSLRSGAGLNGLQTVCSTAVIGELDWSPQVIYQFVGRLNRDGQPDPVTAITLLSECGADPIMAGVLGEKIEQGRGVVDPELDFDGGPTEVPENRVSALARAWLKN